MDGTDAGGGATLYRYRFGGAEFDESRFELSIGGHTADLEQKPLRVLGVLLRRRGEVVSRDELLESIWDGRPIVEQVLSNAVGKLRKALGQDGAGITTVPRTGYRFDGTVERVAVGSRLLSSLELRAGDTVPDRSHFVLRSQLAASASAEVWLAEHRRTGEFRVYKFARDAAGLNSLKREVTLYRVLHEALGDRDDLVKILDWNFEALPFYLECQYVGPNLAEWGAHKGNLANLTRAQRIALFLQIADTVAAAHGVGVLHKDLKPSNVLLGALPNGAVQPRVADFGSGRLLEPERLEELGITQLGLSATQGVGSDSRTGTPLYLAPELLSGGAPTVQSDLFALGCMLYQIIHGDFRRPMAPGWEQGIADELLIADIRAATHGDPSSRLAGVAELTIRLRNTEARRLELKTAQAIRERAESAERALQLARVRRPWITAAGLALVLGLGISLGLYRQEKNARVEAQRAVARAEAINHFLSDDLLGAADPSGPGGAHNPSMREVLARTAATLEGRFGDDPVTKASVDLALGSAYFGMTDYAAAEKYRRDALGLLSTSLGPGNSATLEAEYQLISILAQTNRLDEAATLLESADRLAGKRLEENSRLALTAHWTRAGYFKVRMSVAQALGEYTAADRVRTVIDPANDNLLFRIRESLSWCYMRLGRTQEAEQVLRDLITPRYTQERVGTIYWVVARVDEGTALMSLGKLDDAEKLLLAALQELRATVGADHYFVGYAENTLGELYTRRNQWGDAADTLRDAYRIFMLRVGATGQATLTVAANLGVVQYYHGEPAEAAKVLSGVRTEFIRSFGEPSPQAQIVAFYLACAERELQNYTDASALVSHLDAAALAAAEPRDDWDARLNALRGAVLLGQGHKAEALKLLAPAVAVLEKTPSSAGDLDTFRKALAAAQ